jgi:ornithine cyclodeaminase/alanine dehydrogenase-like protein (mu-crystallin family)
VRTLRLLGAADVEELLDPVGCVAAMEEAFLALARGEVFLPLRTVVRPPGSSSLLGLMPVHRGGAKPVYALKAICIVPDNPARGLDPHQGTVTLLDGVTGQAIAVLDATPVTAIRTAACSALATRALARPDARVLAVVGAGHQARAHLRVLPAVLPLAEARVASRDLERARALAAETGARAFASVEEAIRGADVVVTATSAREPVLRRSWLKEGAHVNAVGACVPDCRELDSATVAASAFFVDRRESAESEAGDYLLALAEGAISPGHIRAELGEVVSGAAPGRASDEEITVFESLGLAVQDLYAAEYVLRRAQETGRGTLVDW